MTVPADGRPSGPDLPADRAGGPSELEAGDVHTGVRAWLGSHGSEEPGRPAVRPASPPEDAAALGPDADHETVARKILLDQLTGQARSRAELATKLAKKNVPDDVADRLLTRFEEVGLIDDEAFARSWVQSRQSGKGLARRALAQELRRKGVPDETAQQALDEVDPEDEVEAARLLVRRKLRSVQRLDRNVAIRRLTGMLARKGYSGGVALRVVREELEAAGTDPGDLTDSFDC